MKDPPRKAKKSPATKKRYRGATHDALSAHAKAVAKRRTHAERSASARKAARTRKRHERH
jgi:hypothetical protein